MRKIAYIELDTHAELVSNFLELSKRLKSVEIHFFISQKIANLLSLKSSENISIANENNIILLLEKKNYDTVIIGTVHRYFSVFGTVTKKYNTSIITHNRNFTSISRFQLLKSIAKEDTIFRLKLLLKEKLLSVNTVYQKAKKIIYLSENMNSSSDKWADKSIVFPVFFNEFPPSIPKKLKVVIPGAVSQKRRDYQRILKKIQNFETPMEIVFLGKAAGNELLQLQNLEKTLPKKIRIKYFEEKVLQSIFDEEMKTASLLWCPIVTTIQFFSQTECYGKTKMSGNIGDAIKYGKVAIFPKTYPNSLPFIYAEEENIEQQIIKLSHINYDFSKEYKVETVAQKLELVLQKI